MSPKVAQPSGHDETTRTGRFGDVVLSLLFLVVVCLCVGRVVVGARC